MEGKYLMPLELQNQIECSQGDTKFVILRKVVCRPSINFNKRIKIEAYLSWELRMLLVLMQRNGSHLTA